MVSHLGHSIWTISAVNSIDLQKRYSPITCLNKFGIILPKHCVSGTFDPAEKAWVACVLCHSFCAPVALLHSGLSVVELFTCVTQSETESPATSIPGLQDQPYHLQREKEAESAAEYPPKLANCCARVLDFVQPIVA